MKFELETQVNATWKSFLCRTEALLASPPAI